MSRTTVGTLAGVIALAVVILLAGLYATQPPPVPACQEDEVIVGQGDFNHNGYWTRYTCVNVEEVH